MATTIRRLVPRDGAIDVAGSLESTARAALQDLDVEDLTVTFGVWEGGDGIQFVCRVETAPGDLLGDQPPWRWWSPLFRTPDELRTQLDAMVARRLGAEPRDATPPSREAASSAPAS